MLQLSDDGRVHIHVETACWQVSSHCAACHETHQSLNVKPMCSDRTEAAAAKYNTAEFGNSSLILKEENYDISV